MSENKSIRKGLLDQLNLHSTKGIFIVFALVILVFTGLYFAYLHHARYSHKAQISNYYNDQRAITVHIDEVKQTLHTSLNSTLMFRFSAKELDRIQAIYALKDTKNKYDALKAYIAKKTPKDAPTEQMQTLENNLSDFDKTLAALLNGDGQLADIISKIGDQENVEATDSLQEDFMMEDVPEGMDLAEVRDLQSGMSQIDNLLFDISNHYKIYFDGLISDELTKVSVEEYIWYFVLLLVIILIASYFTLRNQKVSVHKLSEVLGKIAKGELPKEGESQQKEFDEIYEAGSQIVSYLDDASQFATTIGEGNFDYKFEPKSAEDALGNSLIEMRVKLQQVAKEDKVRNWINEGQARFGEILRVHSDDIDKLGDAIIVELVEYLGASQGALFVISEQDDQRFLELLSAYAYKRKKHISKRIELGEGLAGQVFEEGKSVYMTDINTDHYDIQTGLGASRPSSLLIVPLKNEDQIEGIVEIASLQILEKHQREFVESIGTSIASSLNAGKVNQTTRILLEETQQKAEEMKAQEEELRQNMEELAATQEQMERRNKELEEMQRKLDEEKYLLNALLSSSNDRIYFKDRDSKFIRVSRSMVELFDKKQEEEVLGKSDFDFGFEEHAREAFEDEQQIIRTGKPLIDVVEKETWDDGRITWVSTTKNPLIDLDGNTVGTFGISRDVTGNKRMELEMVKRKAWLENFFKFHPVRFMVLDQHGKINFLSESIEKNVGDRSEEMMFEDVFAEMTFEEFIVKIDFENTKDQEKEILIGLKNHPEQKINFIAVSGSVVNEDGTQNIFLIQQS